VEAAVRTLVMLLMLAGVLAGRLRWLRRLPEEHRIALLAGAGVLDLVLLAAAGRSLTDFIRGGASLSTPAALAGVAASLVAAISLGVVWSAILDDSSRRASRMILLASAALAVFLCLISSPYWAMLMLPLGLRTGWARPLPRRFTGIAISLIGLSAFVAWPDLPARGFCWPPGCDLGLPLTRFARVFLAAQLGIIAFKLIFGLMFGPRSVGRRLLVSHLVAGVVPVALTGLFAILMALLAIAKVRASLATQLLQTQHLVSEQVLARCVDRARELHLDEADGRPAADFGRAELMRLGADIASRWPAESSWRPDARCAQDLGSGAPPSDGPAPRMFVCLNLSRTDPPIERALLMHIPESAQGDTLAGPPVVDQIQAIYEDLSSGASAAGGADAARGASGGMGSAGDPVLSRLPPPPAWLARPALRSASGLVKANGRTFHVSDHRAEWDGARLRVQVIEELPYGCSRIFEKLLDEAVRIEETLRFTPGRSGADTLAARADGIAEGLGGSGRAGALLGRRSLDAARQSYVVSMDSLAATRPPVRRPSTYSSSYVLSPVAQEWTPPGDDAAQAERPAPDGGTAGAWNEIRLSIVGMSSLSDLIPALPHISENLLGLLPFIILISTALLFVLVQTVSLVQVARTGRAIAQSVNVLKIGTEHLQRGDLYHRIPVQGVDELASLGEAFNDMAAGLEQAQRVALEKERLEAELELARQIQMQLLPAEPPVLPGFQIAACSTPARQVGGDYFDFIPLDAEQLFFVLGDVSGKGAPAAILMSGVRAALHSVPLQQEALQTMAGRLNEFIHRSTRISEFVTLFMGTLDGRTGEIRYVNAGQEPPLLIHADGSGEQLEVGGLMLGAFPQAYYEEATATLAPGDLLLLFTDGVSDALDPEGHRFGMERLHAIAESVGSLSAQETLGRVLGELRGFTRGAEVSDDVTLVAIRRT
jgi:serine phosphatase RsbU (regulator of sigma subunit)